MTRAKGKPPVPEAERHEAARIIWGEYFNFILAGLDPGEAGDSKLVGARHTTGKVILAHLDQLWKQGGGAGEDAAAGEAVAGQLGAARSQIASLEGEGADDDGDAGDG